MQKGIIVNVIIGNKNLTTEYLLTDDVVSHETQHLVYVDFLNNVPKSFDNILYTFLTDAL